MLTIRAEQMAALAEQSIRRFEDRLVTAVKAHWPDECEERGDDEVHRLIRSGVQRARGHGLASERQVFRYVNLMFLLGEDFDALPWADAILRDATVGGDEKVDRLVEHAGQLETSADASDGPASDPRSPVG